MFSLLLTCAVMSAVLLTCWTEKVRYFATERPSIRWYNTSYIKDLTATARRYSRKDPQYYMGFHFELVNAMGNNVTLNYYFFEFLTNVYKRSFVELHFRTCDAMSDDRLVGPMLRTALQTWTCPLPRGVYNVTNMTMPSYLVFKNFPFQKGRLYLNATVTGTEIVIGWGHIDIEIRDLRVNGTKLNNK